MTDDITAEIEAAEGRTVRVISSPSTLDRKLHGAETTQYEGTLTGVTTTGGEAGVSEMQKLTVEDGDGEEHRIDVSAWGNEIEDSDDLEVAVQLVEDDDDEAGGDDAEDSTNDEVDALSVGDEMVDKGEHNDYDVVVGEIAEDTVEFFEGERRVVCDRERVCAALRDGDLVSAQVEI